MNMSNLASAIQTPWNPENKQMRGLLDIGYSYDPSARARQEAMFPDAYRKITAPPSGSAFYPNAQNQINAIYSMSGARDMQGNPLTGKSPSAGSYYVPASSADSLPGSGWNPKGGGSGFGGLLGALAPVALGFALGPAGLGLSGIGGGALAGGLTSAVSGGNILKGAALGGLGGGISGYVNSNFSNTPSFAGISPANLASTAGRAGLGLLSGQNPTQALLGGVGSLAGTSAASNFDNPWLKNLAGSSVNTAVRGGDVGTSALSSLLGTTAKYAAKDVSNPFLKDLVMSSPKLLQTAMNRRPSYQPAQAPRPAQGSTIPPDIAAAMVALGKKGYSEEQAKQIVMQHIAGGTQNG